MKGPDGSVDLLHEIAAILVDGYVRLQASKHSTTDRLGFEEKPPADDQNQLASVGSQRDGWTQEPAGDLSTNEGGDATH